MSRSSAPTPKTIANWLARWVNQNPWASAAVGKASAMVAAAMRPWIFFMGAPLVMVGNRSSSLVSEDGLRLEVFLEARDAVFAAVARLLVAAEGRVRAPLGIVDVHLARADARGDAARVREVARLHGGAQAVEGVV